MKECLKCKHVYEDDVAQCPVDGTFLVITITGSTTISGRYVLDSRLGQGGMGIVFRAKHLFLKSLHAVKIILPSLVDDDENLLVRFRQEAILAASIDHPNVIRVTDFGVENDKMPFLVMEFINGIPLSNYLEEGKPLPLEQAFGLFFPAAEGVAEAHSKGIVHRDLKPQNIMVQKNLPLNKGVKVLDFGLAKIKSADSYPSLIQAKTMNIVGSPPYMSPEQWSGEGVDNRTDIYALAVVLYQMLVGHLPFQADSMPAMMYQHLTVPVPTAQSFGVRLSPDIEAILKKALEKEPEDRYRSLDLMLGDLNAVLGRPTSPSVTGAVTEVLIPRSSIEASIPRPSAGTGPELSDSQKERFYSYFGSKQSPDPAANPRLAQNFLEAHDRIEAAKTEAVNADMLVQELAQAQKEAEQAQERALVAKQRIEADVRRQVEAEMQRLAAEDQAKREAEARALEREVEARRAAEQRANYLAQAALEAQQTAERERQKREEEAQQRELHRGVREKAEMEAQQLAAQVAEARRKYEEARNEAAREAQSRAELEARQQKIENDLASLTYNEAERRKQLESQAKQYIEEQASRFEAEAQAAQQRLEEARELIHLEAEKREKAETARVEAENEAARLSKEILEVQRQMEEMRQHITYDSQSGNQSHSSLRGDTVSSLTPITQISGQASADIPPSLLVTSETRKKRSLLAFGAVGAVMMFLVIGGGVGLYFAFRLPVSSPTQVSEGKFADNIETKRPSATDDYILVDAGTFQMGRNDIPNPKDTVWGPQYPAHPVSVGKFYIAPTETTNAQYAECVKDGRCKSPNDWHDGKPPDGKEDYPVVYVSLADAKAYAVWFSQHEKKVCRLPEEKEWEYAARNGSSATNFPWGNEWRPNDSVLSGEAVRVGTSRDVTTTGIKDMLGNVSEWTSTSFYRYEGHPGGLGVDDKLLAVRGLNWATPAGFLKTPERLLTHRQFVDEAEKTSFLGFRLVCEP